MACASSQSTNTIHSVDADADVVGVDDDVDDVDDDDDDGDVVGVVGVDDVADGVANAGAGAEFVSFSASLWGLPRFFIYCAHHETRGEGREGRGERGERGEGRGERGEGRGERGEGRGERGEGRGERGGGIYLFESIYPLMIHCTQCCPFLNLVKPYLGVLQPCHKRLDVVDV